MPDKEGSEDEKTTKGVVKKKKKQMMGEEGYDTYRDNILMRGGDHRSKETKEKSYTPSEQPKGQTVAQKAAKGKSALELVKANITKKYGKGAIMDVKKKSKKKANVQDEFDLTKIAEAFGGYIIEIKNDKDPKYKSLVARFTDTDVTPDPFENVPDEEEAARRKFEADRKRRKFVTGDDPRYKEKPGETRKRVTGTKQGRDTKPKNVPLKPTTKGSKVTTRYATDADERSAAFSDALDDMLSDRRVMGDITPEVKRAGKKVLEKPLKDRVQARRDALDARVKQRLFDRGGSKKAQRQSGATGGKTTGSLKGGNLEFSGDRSGAYRQAQFDADFQQSLRQQGGTGDLGPKMTAKQKAAAQAKRNARIKNLNLPDTSFDSSEAISDKDLEKKLESDIKKQGEGIKSSERQIASIRKSVNKSRSSGGSTGGGSGGSTGGGSGGSTGGGSGGDQPQFNEFIKYARQAAKDAEKLRSQRDKIRNKGNLSKSDKDQLKDINKQIQGAQAMEKDYTSQSVMQIIPNQKVKSPIVTMTGNEPIGKQPVKRGKEIDTPGRETRSAAYLRGQRGGALDKPTKTSAIDKFRKAGGSLIQKTRRYPALSLALYDRLKDTQNPFSIRGGRAGIAAARGGGGL